MELEIIIKGGVELEQFYPEEYEEFMNNLSAAVMNTFPGVIGCILSPEMTTHHQKEETERQRCQDEKFKQELIKILKEPEMRDLFRQQSESAPAES